MRKWVVNRLYDIANVICIVADRLSPTSDEIWRERMWDMYDGQVFAAGGPDDVLLDKCDCGGQYDCECGRVK